MASAATLPLSAQHDDLAPLLQLLEADKGHIRYIGGYVRDQLLGITSQDIDLATNLLPETVLDRLKKAGIKCWSPPSALAHGTVSAQIGEHILEITTLRKDVSTDGRRATIAYTDDWQEDAARRDFTINALSADPLTGEIFDYFGGLADLEQRLVRFIGEPLARIAEDHLRILRFFRFQARFCNDTPDAAALEACTVRANDLMALSRERLAQETFKILSVANPVPTVDLMIRNGIFAPYIPEITEYQRLNMLVQQEALCGISADSLMRLASLLPTDATICDSVAVRLKLSNQDRKRLCAMAGHSPVHSQADVAALAYHQGRDIALYALLISSIPDSEISKLVQWLQDWSIPRLPISGGDLITMGITAGPKVAQTLQAVERAWVTESFPAKERVLKLAQALMPEQ